MTCPLNQVLNHIRLLAWNSNLQKTRVTCAQNILTHRFIIPLNCSHPFIPPLSFILSPLFALFLTSTLPSHIILLYDSHPLIMQTPFQLLFHYQHHSEHAHASGSISYILRSVNLSPEIPVHSWLVPHIPPLCLECIHHFTLLKCKHVVWIPKHFSRRHVGSREFFSLVFVSWGGWLCVFNFF